VNVMISRDSLYGISGDALCDKVFPNIPYLVFRYSLIFCCSILEKVSANSVSKSFIVDSSFLEFPMDSYFFIVNFDIINKRLNDVSLIHERKVFIVYQCCEILDLLVCHSFLVGLGNIE